MNTDLSSDRLELLDDDRLLVLARNVKAYERNEDLSDLVLVLADRLMEARWMYEGLSK